MADPVLDLPDRGFLSAPLAILHGFDHAFAHFSDFVGHEAGTPEGQMVLAMAKGFAAAHGVDPALFDEGGKVVSAAMAFARVLAQENAPVAAQNAAASVTVSTATTVTQEAAQ